MLPFFDKHQETFALELKNVMVFGETMAHFFHDMRKILKLRFFEAAGTMAGILRTSGSVPYCPWQLTTFSISRPPDENKIGDELEAFFLRDGEYPLILARGTKVKAYETVEEVPWLHPGVIPS
jgi:hypothetical protein